MSISPTGAAEPASAELAPGHGEAQAELEAVMATPEEPPKAGRTKR